MEEEKIVKNKNLNMKIYPIYKMLSWDLLFYYSISFLFLTEVKGISASLIMISESVYTISRLVFQIPFTLVIDQIGKKKSLVIGNILIALHIFIMIICTNFIHIIISGIIAGMGYAIKGVCESNILYDSIPKSEKRGAIFSKIDAKGTSHFYYVEAITAVSSGFLYAMNAYIPMILCFIVCIISTYISTKYHETVLPEKRIKKKKAKEEIKTYLKGLKYAFRHMIKSDRLRTLLLFYGVFSAILAVLTTLRSSLLKDLNVPSQYFGIIFAVLNILSGVGSKNQERFHNRFKNKTLAFFSLSVVSTFLVIGFISNSSFSFRTIILVVIVAYAVQYIIKGPYYVLIDKYLKNFTNTSIRTKISAMKAIMNAIPRAIFSFIIAFLFGITTTANTYIILGCIFTIMIVFILDYMRARVGLKPEQYKKEEIEFKELV